MAEKPPPLCAAFCAHQLQLVEPGGTLVRGVVAAISVQELLRTASRTFPLVTIHREKVSPDVCHIGRGLAVSDSEVSLLEIGPDACWDDDALSYRTNEITRVDFGGDYEKALLLVQSLQASRRKRAKGIR